MRNARLERELLALQELGFAKTDSADPEETKTARRMMLNLGVIRGAGLGSSFHPRMRCDSSGFGGRWLAERLQVIDKVLPLATKELRRKKGKTQNSRDRKTKADIKAQKCRDIFAEFTPSQIKKFGLSAVYRDVGQFAAKDLNLLKAISPEAVRKYLAKQNLVSVEPIPTRRGNLSSRLHNLAYDRGRCYLSPLSRGIFMSTAIASLPELLTCQEAAAYLGSAPRPLQFGR